MYVACPTRLMFFYAWHKRWSSMRAREPRGGALWVSPVPLTRIWLTSSQCLYLLCWRSVRTRPLSSPLHTADTSSAIVCMLAHGHIIIVIRWIIALSLWWELLPLLTAVFQLLYIVNLPPNESWSRRVTVWFYRTVTRICALRCLFSIRSGCCFLQSLSPFG